MPTIWKYDLEIDDRQIVEMPEGAELLSVQMQRDRLRLWALVDPIAHKVAHNIIVHGTGHPVGDVGLFIGTVQTHGGQLVWHVFDGGENL